MKPFLIILMIFFHIIDDYYLQGILASMKQKSWWITNISDSSKFSLYKNDYIAALITHAFSWTFMIMLPIAWYMNFYINYDFILIFFINIVIHAFVDNQKANVKTINLIIDQCIHIIQIAVTAFIFL